MHGNKNERHVLKGKMLSKNNGHLSVNFILMSTNVILNFQDAQRIRMGSNKFDTEIIYMTNKCGKL